MRDVFGYYERLKLREQVARIDQLFADTQKFRREANKPRAEESTFDRDCFLAPSLAILGIVGGLVPVATLILHAAGH